MDKPLFLDQKPPAGYIAGVGRGATGFSTRGRSSNVKPKRYQPSNENEIAGEDTEINSKEEELATEVFASIDAKRNGGIRNDDTDGNKVKLQFQDLKRDLNNVTEEEWLHIPEATDTTRRNKRSRLEEQLNRKTYSAPDSLISNSVNLTKLTEEREKVLGRQIDVNFLKSNIDTDNNTDKYLKELESSHELKDNDMPVEELQKMREILTSYRKSDPKRAQGWIASSRLEARAKRYQIAKKLIEEGCHNCPRNEDIWLENISLHESDLHQSKVIVATAINFNARSLKLWMKAIELENEKMNKLRVVRKALRKIPMEEKLWKLAVEYETDSDEKIRVLKRAVEFVPHSIDLLSSLLNLQDYTSAKKTLNSTRKVLANNIEVWILASQLEELRNEETTYEHIFNLLTKGFNELVKGGFSLKFGILNSQANLLLKDDKTPITLEVFVKKVIELLSDDNILKEINELSESVLKIYCYQAILEKKPYLYSVWAKLVKLCESLEHIETLHKIYRKVLFEDNDGKNLMENPNLALMYSKEVWKRGSNIEGAIKIIDQAIKIVPTSLDMWFAKLKLLSQSAEFEQMEILFNTLFQNFDNTVGIKTKGLERLYFKYVSFLRYQMKYLKAAQLLENICIKEFPGEYKFYLQLGQVYRGLNDYQKSREWYRLGTNKFANIPEFWILMSKLDEHQFKNAVRARSILDLGLVKIPGNVQLIVAKAQFEERLNNIEQARLIISQSLRLDPQNSVLWSENIRLFDDSNATSRKTIYQDAVKMTQMNYRVLLAIGVATYQESRYSAALKWFERAVKSNGKYGDSWIWLARCQQQLGYDHDYIMQHCVERAESTEPTHGPLWTSITKNPSTQYCTISQTILKFLNK